MYKLSHSCLYYKVLDVHRSALAHYRKVLTPVKGKTHAIVFAVIISLNACIDNINITQKKDFLNSHEQSLLGNCGVQMTDGRKHAV